MFGRRDELFYIKTHQHYRPGNGTRKVVYCERDWQPHLTLSFRARKSLVKQLIASFGFGLFDLGVMPFHLKLISLRYPLHTVCQPFPLNHTAAIVFALSPPFLIE